MEQFVSFMGLMALLMVLLFVVQSPPLFLVTFFIGCTYLLYRGKTNGWEWPKRP